MSKPTTLWQRIKGLFRPETETYETRRARPSGETTTLPEQYDTATDPRRSGGSGAIGG